MSLVIRPAGYTGSLQQMTWTQGNSVQATAYLWGGGGGGGGNDTGVGGNGGGGQFSRVNFSVSEGDILELAVGGPGAGGASYARYGAGGTPGASLIVNTIFNTRTAVPVSGAAFSPVQVSSYCTFLNTYGGWVGSTYSASFDQTYDVNFPLTGTYQFQASADNYAIIYIDGRPALEAYDYRRTYEIGITVPAGAHSIRIVGVNTGGPGSVALVITNGSSYGGGGGGNSGSSGTSGAGGGGGGATVLLKNGTVIGVASGGGGGGGGGNRSPINGDSAPGTGGQAAPGDDAGQNGAFPAGDGGGGGGGGGGEGGGNGGGVRGGDTGAFAGSYGGGLGFVFDPFGRTPGGSNNPYYIPNVAQGGAGGGGNGVSGYAVAEFEISGISVNVPGQGWTQTTNVFVKTNSVWQQVQGTWIKSNNVWEPAINSYAPNWVAVAGKFGVNPRPASSNDPGTGAGLDLSWYQ
jgi:hypothetical protein